MADKKAPPGSSDPIPDFEEFAGLGTILGRLAGNVVITQLRLEALRDVLSEDADLKSRYVARYRELRSEKRKQLRDKLLLTDEAYERRYPDQSDQPETRNVLKPAATRKAKTKAKPRERS